MAYENKPGQIFLWSNRDKVEGDNRPDFKGDGTLELKDGTTAEIEIAAWQRESKNGNPYLSLNVKLKGARQAARPPQSDPKAQFRARVEEIGTPVDNDKDIPF
jgi:hypothetical protein